MFVTWRIAVMTSYNVMHMCMATYTAATACDYCQQSVMGMAGRCTRTADMLLFVTNRPCMLTGHCVELHSSMSTL